MNKKVEDMKATTVSDIQKQQAASSGQMDQLEQEISSLKGQLEEMNYRNQKLKEQNKELETSITAKTQQEIANRIGASREMVNHVLRDLVRGGLIVKDSRHRMTIVGKLPKRW